MVYWNEVAANYIEEAGLTDRGAAHVFALMHAAQFDALLTCFESKYFYNLLRPNQANPAITLAIGQPSYPAYPSGYACLSGSAAGVLEYFFPTQATDLANLVTEAGESRILGGIHYRFDIPAGRNMGETVAEWAIAHQDRLR